MESIDTQIKGYITSINASISKKGNSATLSIITGTLLVLAGLFITLKILCNKCQPDCFDFCCCDVFIHLIFIYLPLMLTSIVAIILFIIYKSSLKQADVYRNEIIVLNEISLALEICKTIPEDEFDSTTIIQTTSDTERETEKYITQRTKTKQQIIETLLSRCN